MIRFQYFILAALLTITWPLSTGATDPVQDNNLRIATWKFPKNFDPVYATTSEQVLLFNALFEGLVREKEGKIVPADAQSWEISQDQKTYTFKLRDDITWSDVKPVTAHDYVLGISRLLDKSADLEAHPTYMISTIKNAKAIEKGEMVIEDLGIKALDNKTLVIELEAPASFFLEVLNYVSLAPIPGHIYEKHGNDWWKQQPYVSNGSYTLESSSANSNIILKKRDNGEYPDAPKSVQLLLVESIDTAVLKILKNELDILYDVRKGEIKWIKNRMGLKRWDNALPSTVYVPFNTLNGKLADKRVRQALALAIDREAIAHATGLRKARSFAPPDLLKGGENDLVDPHAGWTREQKLAKAYKLLAEAGYGPGNPLEVELTTVKRDLLGSTVMALRAMFNQLGVKVSMTESKVEEFSARLSSKQYEVTAADWLGDYNDAMTFYSILQTGASKNHSAFSNAEFDALIDKALNTQDNGERGKIYAKMEKILQEEVPVLPIIHGEYSIIASPRVESMDFEPAMILPINKIRLQKTHVGE